MGGFKSDFCGESRVDIWAVREGHCDLTKDRPWHSEYREEIVGRFKATGSKRIALSSSTAWESERA